MFVDPAKLREKWNIEALLFIAGLLAFALPKALTNFEIGDGLPYHIGIAVRMVHVPGSWIEQPFNPLYYWMLAAVYAVTRSIQIVGMLTPIMSALAVSVAYWFLRHHVRKEIAFLAAGIMMLTPEYVSIGTSTHPEPFLTILILISFHFLLQKKPLHSGIFFGLAQLVKYSALAFYPVVATTDLIRRRKINGELLKKVVIVFGISLLISGAFYSKNYYIYGNPLHPRAQGSYLPDPAYALAKYGGIARYIGITYDSFYFANTNVGPYFPEEVRFAHGYLFFSWGSVLSFGTPGERQLQIHIFDIIASGFLFIITLLGAYNLYRTDRKFFLIAINFIFWFGLLYISFSLAGDAQPSTRYAMPVYPFISLFTAFGIIRFRGKTQFAVLILAGLSLLYLYELQLARMVAFSQHYEEVLRHPYLYQNIFQYIK